jgi:hypothetical protein
VFLVREPDNKHSRNAIALRLKDGLDIGYVPEADAVYLAPLLDKGSLQFASVKKVLTGGRAPIPVVWGELYNPDAPLPDASRPDQVPARRTAPGGSVSSPKPRRSKTGCLVVALAVIGIAILL